MFVILRGCLGTVALILTKLSGIAATNISRLENGHMDLGKQRAIALAKAIAVHPATLMFPDFRMAKAA